MKLQPDRADQPIVNAFGPGWVAVNGQRWDSSLLLAGPVVEPLAAQRHEDLSAEFFETLAARLGELAVEVLLLGSGARLRFVPPAWLAPLMERRIGVETMDSNAACRTYNFLVAEQRRVALALLVENPG